MRRRAFWCTHFHVFHAVVLLRHSLPVFLSIWFGGARHLHHWVCVWRVLCQGTASKEQHNEDCCRDSFHRLSPYIECRISCLSMADISAVSPRCTRRMISSY